MSIVTRPLLIWQTGDAFGVSTSIAVVGLLAFVTLPLCLMLSPALRAARA